MAISKEKKGQVVAELTEMLARSKATVIADYRGLTAAQMGELRNKLRPLDSRFLVAKNTLILRSLGEASLPQPEDLLQGPTALGFCFENIGEPLKAIMDFVKETEILTVKGGLMGERIISPAEIKTLSEMPGVDVLRAQMLAGLQSPMSGLVGLLDSALKGLLYALDARAEQLGEATA